MAPLTLILVAATWLTMKPLVSGSMLSSVVTSAAVVFRLRCGSFALTIPRAVSHTNQSPVLSVRLMRTNRAPVVNPQLMVWLEPLPV